MPKDVIFNNYMGLLNLKLVSLPFLADAVRWREQKLIVTVGDAHKYLAAATVLLTKPLYKFTIFYLHTYLDAKKSEQG